MCVQNFGIGGLCGGVAWQERMKAGCLYAIYSGARCCAGPGVDLVREANDSDRLSKIEWLPVAVYLNKIYVWCLAGIVLEM